MSQPAAVSGPEQMPAALGLIEVEGVAGIVVAADAACKAAAVELLGWESIGGFTTVFFGGSTSAVEAALHSGAAAARAVAPAVTAAAVTRPQAVCLDFISFPLPPGANDAGGALGLIETRGYGAHVSLDDAMAKAADVALIRVLTVHNRVVCTLISGDVASVQAALDVGRGLLGDSPNFMTSALLPQPLPEVRRAFVDGG